MQPAEVYDWLLKRGVTEPAVLQLGELWFVGSWTQIPRPTNYPATRYRLSIGGGQEKKWIYVYGEGLTARLAWEDARNRVSFRDLRP